MKWEARLKRGNYNELRERNANEGEFKEMKGAEAEMKRKEVKGNARNLPDMQAPAEPDFWQRFWRTNRKTKCFCWFCMGSRPRGCENHDSTWKTDAFRGARLSGVSP